VKKLRFAIKINSPEEKLWKTMLEPSRTGNGLRPLPRGRTMKDPGKRGRRSGSCARPERSRRV
jgi:hypothetical protein